MILKISRKLPFLSLFICLLLPIDGFGETQRTLHRAIYEGEYNNFSVSMTRTLISLGGDRYKLVSRTENFFGSISEQEEFWWTAQKSIRPIVYRYEQRIFGIKKSRSIKFDWNKLSAQSKYKKKKRKVPLSEGVLGPMTYQLMLQIDLLTGSEHFEYSFIKQGKLKKYTFRAKDIESIHYKDQKISKALNLTRENEGRKKKTSIWFDTEQHYTLSSLQQIKKNDRHMLFVTSSKYMYPLNDTPLAKLITAPKKAR